MTLSIIVFKSVSVFFSFAILISLNCLVLNDRFRNFSDEMQVFCLVYFLSNAILTF